MVMGVGAGTLVSGEVYLMTAPTMDKSDLLLNSLGGAIEGGLAVSPWLGGVGLGPIGRRALMSGIVRGTQAGMQDIANGNAVDPHSVLFSAEVSVVTMGISDIAFGGLGTKESWRMLDRAVPWQPTLWLDRGVNARDIYRGIAENGRATIKTSARDIGYWRGVDYLYQRYLNQSVDSK